MGFKFCHVELVSNVIMFNYRQVLSHTITTARYYLIQYLQPGVISYNYSQVLSNTTTDRCYLIQLQPGVI